MMKSCTVLLYSTWDMNHPFAQQIHVARYPPISHLVVGSVIKWVIT